MKQHEEKAIQEVLRKLCLKRHECNFEYFDSISGHKIVFEWDGAGIRNSGSIILIELELAGVLDWHIQTHLSRLAVMIAQGTPIEKLVWVIDRAVFQSLKKTVDAWISFFVPVCRLPLPGMEYRTLDGELLQ